MFTGPGPLGIAIRDFLNGVWLAHPLHAALSDVPVGLFTGAVVLDVLGLAAADLCLERPAQWCVGLGTVGALAAAVAGVAAYSEVESPRRRQATAHGLINIGRHLHLTSAARSRRVRYAARRSNVRATARSSICATGRCSRGQPALRS